MNKPELKLEGDVLKVNFAQDVSVDKDSDGKHSFKAGVSLNVEIQALELADELMKSTKIVEYIKEKLGKK